MRGQRAILLVLFDGKLTIGVVTKAGSGGVLSGM